MDILKEMYNLKGCRLRFCVGDNEYEGTVGLIIPSTKRITMEKVIFLPRNLVFGLQHFYAHEFKSYSVIEKLDASQNCKSVPKASAIRYSYENGTTGDNHILDDSYDQDDVVSECDTETGVCLEDVAEGEYELLLPEDFKKRLPLDSVIMDHIDTDFFDAIWHIKNEDSIGLSLEGTNIGRKGGLQWLCISTRCCTFLFDIKSLGENAFSEGLREILENQNIEKIIHDCRQASDCLFHQFRTRLINVFDTQVADFFVNMQFNKNKKRLVKHVFTVDNCLARYLNVEAKFLHSLKRNKKLAEEDSVMWASRPLSNKYRDRAITNVLYLKLLRKELHRLMMNPFYRAVDVYLGVLQNASEQELDLEPSVPHLAPPALLMEGIQTVCFETFEEVSLIPTSGSSSYTPARDPIERLLKCFKRSPCTENSLEEQQSDPISANNNKSVNVIRRSLENDSTEKPCEPAGHSKLKMILNIHNGTRIVKQTNVNKIDETKECSSPEMKLNSNNVSLDKLHTVSSSSEGDDLENYISNRKKQIPTLFRTCSSVTENGQNDAKTDRPFNDSSSSNSSDEINTSKITPIKWAVYNDREMPKNVILLPAGMLTSTRSKRRSKITNPQR